MHNTFLRILLVGTALTLGSMALQGCSPLPGGGGGPNDGGNTNDGGQPTLAFAASNIVLTGHDLSTLGDEDVSSDCDLETDQNGSDDCFNEDLQTTVSWIAQQSDGSTVRIYAMGSLRLESTATIHVRGGLPAIIVSIHDITLNGTVDDSAVNSRPGAGGFTQTATFTQGGGPGGGPAGNKFAGGTGGLGNEVGIASGGASFCDVGGSGGIESGAVLTAPAPTPAYGSADLRPLVGGSSGGGAGWGIPGAGGGALQLTAGGTFSLGQFAVIDLGGGGGTSGGELHAEQQAEGGGSGGALLIEAQTISVLGTIAANGGAGGGHDTSGADALASTVPALGGVEGSEIIGGNGAAAATATGTAGIQGAAGHAGGGGGAAGRVRLNSSSGSATLSGTLSPSVGTACVTQGTVRAAGSGG